jgi:cytochrome oxidase Cu insertion factor (SCO1/SenC/PrrC family)
MRRLALLATVALIMAACAPAAGGPQVGDPAPDFSLPDTNGDPVSLSDYTPGRPVLLYFHMAVG